MTKRIIAIALLAVLAMTLFVACGTSNKEDKIITEEQAKQIALQEIGKTEDQVDDIHIHKTTYQQKVIYQVHIHAGAAEFAVYVDQTGKVINTIKG